MRSHHWSIRQPDWLAAVVAGFIAGALLMLLELLWQIIVVGASPWGITYKVAGIVMNSIPLDNLIPLDSTDFNIGIVALALSMHYLLGIGYGMILALIIASFHFDSSIDMTLALGAGFGLVLYFFNFYGMVYLFPWFAAMRGMTTLIAHLFFGMTAAFAYWKLDRHQ